MGQDYAVGVREGFEEAVHEFANKRLHLACLSEQLQYNCSLSKGQTRREAGTQSHGPVSPMRTGRQTARPPNFCFGGFLFIFTRRFPYPVRETKKFCPGTM